MSRRAESSRSYHSPRRGAKAQATRWAIIDAARRLFVERGYSSTSVSAIASQAGVAPETIYADFGSKRAILAKVLEVALAAHDAPVALVDWPELSSVRAEPDPTRKIQLLAGLYRAIYQRSAAVLDVMRAAAYSEPQLAEVLRVNQQERFVAQAKTMQHFAQAGALRPGVTVQEATDSFWAIGSPEVYMFLVRNLWWAPDQYERWLSRTLCRLLLDDPGASEGATLGGVPNGGCAPLNQRSNDPEEITAFRDGL